MLKLIGILALMGIAFYAGTQYQKNKTVKQQVRQQVDKLMEKM